MRLLTTTALVSLLACGTAWAQGSDLQSRLGADQFRALGLHKLAPAELAGLERWLDTQAPATAQLEEARDAGRREAERELARAQPAATAGPVDSALVGTFNGFGKGREYTLANGQVWRQTDSTELPGVSVTNAMAQIRPGRVGGWWLKINSYNVRARVERVR